MWIVDFLEGICPVSSIRKRILCKAVSSIRGSLRKIRFLEHMMMEVFNGIKGN
jgi:hypothetical protein